MMARSSPWEHDAIRPQHNSWWARTRPRVQIYELTQQRGWKRSEECECLLIVGCQRQDLLWWSCRCFSIQRRLLCAWTFEANGTIDTGFDGKGTGYAWAGNQSALITTPGFELITLAGVTVVTNPTNGAQRLLLAGSGLSDTNVRHNHSLCPPRKQWAA